MLVVRRAVLLLFSVFIVRAVANPVAFVQSKSSFDHPEQEDLTEDAYLEANRETGDSALPEQVPKQAPEQMPEPSKDDMSYLQSLSNQLPPHLDDSPYVPEYGTPSNTPTPAPSPSKSSSSPASNATVTPAIRDYITVITDADVTWCRPWPNTVVMPTASLQLIKWTELNLTCWVPTDLTTDSQGRVTKDATDIWVKTGRQGCYINENDLRAAEINFEVTLHKCVSNGPHPLEPNPGNPVPKGIPKLPAAALPIPLPVASSNGSTAPKAQPTVPPIPPAVPPIQPAPPSKQPIALPIQTPPPAQQPAAPPVQSLTPVEQPAAPPVNPSSQVAPSAAPVLQSAPPAMQPSAPAVVPPKAVKATPVAKAGSIVFKPINGTLLFKPAKKAP